MTDYEEKIYSRLKSDYDYVVSLGYTVLGVFLQGSQNYGLSYEGSDIDTKAIIIPSFNDFCLNKKPVSTTLVLPSNEHIDLKDIRLMHDCFRKQNINFLEILFTKFYIINGDYYTLYEPMLNNAEKIAHYNNYAAVNCIAGMAYEKHKAMEHPYEGLRDKIEKYGYDNKQLHHIVRCEEFLKRYISGVPYAECLISEYPKYLIDIKSSYIYSLEEARVIANKSLENVKQMKQEYMDNNDVIVDKEVETIMNEVLLNVFKKKFKLELGC